MRFETERRKIVSVGAVRHTQRTKNTVIAEFKRLGRVDLACAAAGCDRTTHYIWLKNDSAYAAAFEAARDDVAGMLEDEAVRRAYHGTMKPMNVGGKVMMVHEFSDTLLIFLLKSRNPKVFGDRNAAAAAVGPVNITIQYVDRAVIASAQPSAPAPLPEAPQLQGAPSDAITEAS